MTDTPIYEATRIALAGHYAREAVRAGLRLCPTCGAAINMPCHTASGRRCGDHARRAA